MKPLHELINHEESALPLVQSWAAGAKQPARCYRRPNVAATCCTACRSPPARPWARSPTAQAACSSMAAGCACWDRDTPAHARHRRLERRPLERLPADRRRCRRRLRHQWRRPGRGRGCPVLLGARHPGMGTAGTELYRLPALGAGRRTGGVLRRAALARLAGRYAGPGGDQGFSFYPFLWTREGSPSTSSRKAVDMAELYAMNAGQVGG